MLRRTLSLLFICLLVGCHHRSQAPSPAIQPSIKKQITENFTRVSVTGNLDVNLHTGVLHSQVVPTVKDGILRVSLGKGYPHHGPMKVDISTHYLSSFTYRGKGTVTGMNLHSNALDVHIQNKGKTLLQGQLDVRNLDVTGPGYVQLNGVNSHLLQVKLAGKPHVQVVGTANLNSLDMKGTGWFSLYWVKSNRLKIRAKDDVFFQLAGITEILDVELWGKARFNGRYLRAMRSFVKTHDHSEADIATVARQHTFATDTSNIYFYNLPDMKADFMGCNGAVLDMREWGRPFMQEPTRYNL
jgi:hypothetical protein